MKRGASILCGTPCLDIWSTMQIHNPDTSLQQCPSMTLACSICANVAGNSTYTVAEMMYGSGELFDYFECAECKCLQIAAVPDDLSRYYPSTYYRDRKSTRLN